MLYQIDLIVYAQTLRNTSSLIMNQTKLFKFSMNRVRNFSINGHFFFYFYEYIMKSFNFKVILVVKVLEKLFIFFLKNDNLIKTKFKKRKC